MITLALDASTYTGEVAVLGDGRLLAEAATAMKGANEERLMPAVAQVLEQAAIDVSDVDRVVCGAGPGSFTSLRIAGAIAKGIATGIGCPLFAVPSMALVIGAAQLAAGRYLVAIDALRGEFYVGLFSVDERGTPSEIERARLASAADIDRLAAEFASKVVSPSPSVDGIVALPRARAVAKLDDMLTHLGPVDTRSWEPSYGRLAEAQVRWEAAHGTTLSVA